MNMEVEDVQSEITIGESAENYDRELNNALQMAVTSIEKATALPPSPGGYTAMSKSSTSDIIEKITKRISEEKNYLVNQFMQEGCKVTRKGDSYYLITHRETKKTKFVCIHCSRCFVSKWSLLKHRQFDQQASENKDTPKFICKDYQEELEGSTLNTTCHICSKVFPRERLLKTHLESHFRTKDYECSVCQKRFQQFSHLNNHYTIHTGIKNFVCKICDKRFKQSGHLLNHTKTHTGEKRFQCGFCDKCFTQKIHLKSHLTIHTGEKEHRCLLCGKYFAQSGHLQAHMRTHTGERKYHCKSCGMKFKQSGHLSTHEKLHIKQELRRKELEEHGLSMEVVEVEVEINEGPSKRETRLRKRQAKKREMPSFEEVLIVKEEKIEDSQSSNN